MVIVSPGVYTREIDLSLYVPQLATAIFGMVGTASKGPVNELTNITDESSLIATFGKPSAAHLSLYGALRYLRKGKSLKFIRVARYDAAATGELMNAANTVVAAAIEAVSTGSWGNSITIVVSAGTGVDPISGADTYKLTILYEGATAEVYDLVVFDPAHSTSANYITTRINGVSDYIMVTPVVGQSDLLVSTTPVGMAGGLDGAPADVSDYVGAAGTPPSVPATGLQIFRNVELIDVNMIAVSDVQDRDIISEMVSICESRADCMCLIDVPQNKSVQEAVAWANGLGGGPVDPTAAINSSYAAIFYPWIQVYDGYSNSDVWVPPSGHIAGVIANTDYVANPWSAPAGLQRAILQDALDVEHSANQGERDYMYSNGNVVNPVVNFPGQGIVVWGQRTSQRQTTALDRINVRRLVLYLRKAIATAVRPLVFEPNDSDTWAQFRNLLEPICQDVMSRRGLYDFRVICDESTNTSAVINRNELRGKVLIKPTKTAEMITVDFVILNNEAQFSEF
jgi:phage tail sheath protein FI